MLLQTQNPNGIVITPDTGLIRFTVAIHEWHVILTEIQKLTLPNPAEPEKTPPGVPKNFMCYGEPVMVGQRNGAQIIQDITHYQLWGTQDFIDFIIENCGIVFGG